MPLIRKPAGADAATSSSAADPFASLIKGDAGARRAAARSLANLPGGIKALGKAVAAEGDFSVREAIFTSLARSGDLASVEAVLPHLRSDDANLRTGALDALRAMPDAVRPMLPALLADTDPDVRLLVCEIVRGLDPRDATPMMIELLDRETEVNVCASAVDVLAELGGSDAVPALRRCAGRFSGEQFLRFSIEAAIDQIGSQSGSPRG